MMHDHMYGEAVPFTTRYVSSISLYWIRKLTGSQCKSDKIGEMCSEGFVRVTSLAAVFCFSCSLWIWSLGSPNKMALPMSKRDDTKAWTNCSVAYGLRYLRILPRFLSWNDADLITDEIWGTRVIVLSIKTPRLRTCETGAIVESPIFMCGMVILLRLFLEPMSMNSVLLSFSLRQLSFIHWRISSTHASIREIHLLAASWFESKAEYNWVSSA